MKIPIQASERSGLLGLVPSPGTLGLLERIENGFFALLDRAVPERFDRYNSRHLFRAFVAITFGSALVYFLLSFTNNHGLMDGNSQTHNPFTALYFSVATETTVGYGDVVAKGLSRAFTCIQALLGLTLAGMTIEKITSGPGAALRRPVKQCTGTWTEFIEIPPDFESEDRKTRLMICFINISYLNATIRYDGNNFNQDGEELGYFRGELAPNSNYANEQLAFRYSNRDSRTIHFDSGITTLTFAEKLATGQMNKFYGVAHDDKLHFDRPLIGLRATELQAEIINSTKFDRKRALAVAQAQLFYSRDWSQLDVFTGDLNIPDVEDIQQLSDIGPGPLPESQYRTRDS